MRKQYIPAFSNKDRFKEHPSGFNISSKATKMRKHPTKAEAVMEYILKSLGLKVINQKQMGPFIVDFFLPQLQIVIEVDGSYHSGRSSQDSSRTQKILHYNPGVQLIRYGNGNVLNNLEFAKILKDDLIHLSGFTDWPYK